MPIDYWATQTRSSKKAANVQSDPGSSEAFEAEDRVLLDEPYIEDADRYIDEIHFAVPVFDFSTDFFNQTPTKKVTSGPIRAGTMDALEEAVGIAEQRNIPYYIHTSKETSHLLRSVKRKHLLVYLILKNNYKKGWQRSWGTNRHKYVFLSIQRSKKRNR